MVIDYIGIRDNMREAMKIYGGDTSVAPTEDDVERFNAVSDGVIVGSKIVKALHEGQVAEIADFIREAVASQK